MPPYKMVYFLLLSLGDLGLYSKFYLLHESFFCILCITITPHYFQRKPSISLQKLSETKTQPKKLIYWLPFPIPFVILTGIFYKMPASFLYRFSELYSLIGFILFCIFIHFFFMERGCWNVAFKKGFQFKFFTQVLNITEFDIFMNFSAGIWAKVLHLSD